MIIKDNYDYYKVKTIAECVGSIKDTRTLDILLKSVLIQMCKIGGAQEGKCIGCHYQLSMCLKINDFLEWAMKDDEDGEGDVDDGE